MPTLFLSAPGSSQVQDNVRTFDVRTIFADGIAPDYAITVNLIEQVSTGMKVVVFDRADLQPHQGGLRFVQVLALRWLAR